MAGEGYFSRDASSSGGLFWGQNTIRSNFRLFRSSRNHSLTVSTTTCGDTVCVCGWEGYGEVWACVCEWGGEKGARSMNER